METELTPRPTNDHANGSSLHVTMAGSPGAIELAARFLRDQIHVGSVDADSFAANVTLALNAMGVQVPAMFAGMIGNAVRAGYTP